MIEISEIKDEDSLKAWLNEQPRAFPRVIAARSALRVLPVFWDWSLSDHASRSGVTALPVLRCNLVAAVACKSSNFGSKKVTAAATRAANVATAATAFDDAVSRSAAVTAAAATYGARATFRDAGGTYDTVRNEVVNAAAQAAEAASCAAQVTAFAAGAELWRHLSWDCSDLKGGRDLLRLLLWRDNNPLANLWEDLRPQILSAENWQNGAWRFWVSWYDQMLDPISNPPNWKLLERVASIESEVWDAGPEAVNELIVDIHRDFKVKPTETQADTSGSIAVGQKQTEVIAHAMVENRRTLPATFDAILGYIELEIERLQRKRNYTSDAEAEEARRQAAVLSTIADAVRRLQELVPQTDAISDEAAQEAGGLGTLIQQRIKEWPTAKPGEAVDNVSDIVDGSVRSSLIGTLAVGSHLIGMDATPVLLVGGTILGGQKLISRYRDVQGALKD